MPSVPYGKGDVRKAVGRCLTAMDGGISKRLCGPLVAVGAMCCVRAFRDVLLKHEKHRHGYICTKQPARIAALQL